MKPIDHILKYIREFGCKVNTVGQPNWIVATFCDDEKYYEEVIFDFKNDFARKAFGALCHVIYTSAEHWRIQTERQR